MRAALQKLARRMQETPQPLAEILSAYPAFFPPVVVRGIGAAEQAGELPRVLREFAEHYEREMEWRRQLAKATIYFKVSLLVALLLVWIVAQLGFISPVLVFLFLLPVVLYVAYLIALRLPGLRDVVLTLGGALPVLGRLYRYTASARFSAFLGILLRAGLPFPEALELAGTAAGHPAYRQFGLLAADRLRQNQPWPEILRLMPRAGPADAAMLQVGMETGDPSEALQKLAQYHTQAADALAHQVAAALPPILTLVMGGMVLLVLVQFYTGYFQRIFSLLNE